MLILAALFIGAVAYALYEEQTTGSPVSTLTGPLSDIANAIANAEGFGASPSNIPTSRNNPGDITSAGKVATYGSAADGWNALYNLLQSIVAGTSKYYNTSMTWVQIGNTYSGGDPNWAQNVAAYLGVDPNSTMADYLSS